MSAGYQRYAELHCHSSFSFLDGASNPEELVIRANELGLSALAITDHDDFGGIVRFAYSARELEFPAIIGCELTLEDDSHLILLVENEQGYRNLSYMLTQARMQQMRGNPRVSYQQLEERSKGLFALSGCPNGRIPSALYLEHEYEAKEIAGRLKEIFPERFYIEVWNHFLNQESVISRRLLELSNSMAIPWVVTNNVHYAIPDGRMVHDVLTCLKHDVTLANAGRRLRANGSFYMKSPEEMVQLWRHDLTGIKNTVEIADRCKFRLGAFKPPLPNYNLEPGTTHNGILEKLVWQGAKIRYPDLTEKHLKQINYELSMITNLGLAPYFLIMWDIVDFARRSGIAVQGRGSAANSAVCYCLMITAVDPIGMDLLFERFLSSGRNEPPDIDLDIAHQEREKVLQYVYEKYGREHAAMVCEVITYRGRSAVRDAARVLGFSQEQADALSSESRHMEAHQAAINLRGGGAEKAGLDPKDKRVQQLIRVVAGLHQLPRHRSIHVGGFVLCGTALGEVVPIEPAAMDARTVIQWDKDDIDLMGLIKIDLLGLGMLTLIQEGLKHVHKHRGLDIDIGRLDMSDPAIYEMLTKADTVGVFQVESRAQMNILPRIKPNCFYDIIVSIAIVRPGPIQGNIVHPYLRRRRGDEQVTYLHPTLEPILKRTLGVPLFQEQGMKLAVVAAGFTPAQADHLRRVMSHKRSLERMAALCDDLAAGMKKNNFSQEAIETITHQLRAFANYGFPESHAASFSLLVYASAYLKRYFPTEFFCAILNAQPMGFYSPATLIRDAINHGVEVLSVDLAKSDWDCTIEVIEQKEGFGAFGFANANKSNSAKANTEKVQQKLALRVGLRFVHGLGNKAMNKLKAVFAAGGKFTSVDDVIQRSGLAPSELKMLARAGAFESLFPGRRNALWEVLSKLSNPPETPLLDLLSKQPEENVPPMTDLEEIVADFRTLGLSTGPHPMLFYRDWATNTGIKSCHALTESEHGKIMSVAGGVICRQKPETAKGFVFITLEDETGVANIIVNPKVFSEFRHLILRTSFMSVSGKLQLEDGVANILAEKFERLPVLPGNPILPARDFH
ncbi:MAG: error-prone DNA polymerase [Candidatus Melainabacteria bacterium]|nr:error-prone DNA polymerase [Candidatus Melainabacteria bacterium]